MFSKGRAIRRWIAVVLAVAMVCGMVPWSTVEAQAAAQDVSVVQPETMYPEGITVNLYDYWRRRMQRTIVIYHRMTTQELTRTMY